VAAVWFDRRSRLIALIVGYAAAFFVAARMDANAQKTPRRNPRRPAEKRYIAWSGWSGS
jgi:hypothetical protein